MLQRHNICEHVREWVVIIRNPLGAAWSRMKKVVPCRGIVWTTVVIFWASANEYHNHIEYIELKEWAFWKNDSRMTVEFIWTCISIYLPTSSLTLAAECVTMSSSRCFPGRQFTGLDVAGGKAVDRSPNFTYEFLSWLKNSKNDPFHITKSLVTWFIVNRIHLRSFRDTDHSLVLQDCQGAVSFSSCIKCVADRERIISRDNWNWHLEKERKDMLITALWKNSRLWLTFQQITYWFSRW